MPIKVLSPNRELLRKYKKPRRHEEETIQQATIHALRAKGYRVEQTSHRVKLTCCPKCHTKFHPSGAYGATKGISDLLIRNDRWPDLFWIQIEMKGPKTPLSPEQKEKRDADALAIARTVDEAVAIVAKAEKNFDPA